MARTSLALPMLLAAVLSLQGCKDPAAPAIQGYVEGEYVRIAAPFAGTLLQLNVQRGADVAAGAALFALEAEGEDAARREAQQRALRAEAQVADLRGGKRPSEIQAASAQLAQAEVVAGLSAKEYARQLDLVAKGFVSQQRADEARAARDRDRARVAELQAELATVRAGARSGEIRAAEAEAGAAREAVAQASIRLKQKSVVSTVAGRVVDTLFTLGEWVPAGAPVVSLLPPQNVKVRFFVPEPRLANVRVGQSVAIACDACPSPLTASVSFIAPQAEFTPPVIYSKDNRAKMVFLVEARLQPQDAAKLHPGLPVDVTLP